MRRPCIGLRTTTIVTKMSPKYNQKTPKVPLRAPQKETQHPKQILTNVGSHRRPLTSRRGYPPSPPQKKQCAERPLKNKRNYSKLRQSHGPTRATRALVVTIISKKAPASQIGSGSSDSARPQNLKQATNSGHQSSGGRIEDLRDSARSLRSRLC